MEKVIEGTIQSCEFVREGFSAKTGKPWKMYKAYIGGIAYPSFNEERVGDSGKWTVKEEQNGKYINRTLVGKVKANPELDALEKRVSALERFTGMVPTMPQGNPFPARTLEEEAALPQIDVDEDVKPEDLPFNKEGNS